MHLARCRRFWLWAVVGALITFSVVAAASIGLFILPFAVLAAAFVARTTRRRADALGVLLGAASICFLIAGLHLGDEGGADARPWFVAGVLLAALGTAGYAFVTGRLAPRA